MGPLNIVGVVRPAQSGRFDREGNVERVYVADLESQDQSCRIFVETKLSEEDARKNVALIRSAPLLAEVLRAIADPEHYATRHTVDGLRRLARGVLEKELT